jgi:nucleoside-diphosphate-sugar epimerase
MRIVVTGGTGLIGSHLVDLLAADAEVHVISRFARPSDAPEVTWHQADLTEPGAILRVLRKARADAVCHLAGLVNGARSIDALLPTLRSNVVATAEVLDAVTRLGCGRLVVAGSLLEEPTNGTGVPGSPYGASRAASTAYSRMCHALFGTHVVVLRPSYVYGPKQDDSTKLLPHVIMTLLSGGSPSLTRGARTLDWLYATDAAEAFRAALTAPGVDGEVIDLVSGFEHTVREVVELVCTLLGPTSGRPEFGATPSRPFEQDVRVRADRAAELLGWRAQTSLAEGLARTVAWFATRTPAALAEGTRSAGGGVLSPGPESAAHE